VGGDVVQDLAGQRSTGFEKVIELDLDGKARILLGEGD